MSLIHFDIAVTPNTPMSMNANGPLIVAVVHNANPNAEDPHNTNYKSHFRLAIKDGSKHNCGCRRDDPLCCSCCNLWLSSHFWAVFFFIEVPFYVVGNTYNFGSFLDISICVGTSLLLGILPSILYLYSIYQCMYYPIYWIRASLWLQYAYCLLFMLAAFSGSAYETYDGDTDFIASRVPLNLVQLIPLVWADNVFTKTQVWAKYFKNNGMYPPIMTIWDFPNSYVCCMKGCCSCGC
eukprot:111294_1